MQAALQQTESTHWPLPHSAATEHLEPSFCVQLPSWPGAAQVAPVPQLADAQQTPSVHESPLAHAEGSVHGLPRPSTAVHAEALLSREVPRVLSHIQPGGPPAPLFSDLEE